MSEFVPPCAPVPFSGRAPSKPEGGVPVAGAAAVRPWWLSLASCDDDMRFWNSGGRDDDCDDLSRWLGAKGLPSSRSSNRLGVSALGRVQSDLVASREFAMRGHWRYPLQRSGGSLHTSHLNGVSTMSLAHGSGHSVLIFLCVILATQVIQLGIMKSDAGGPRVCGTDLIVINVFFRM